MPIVEEVPAVYEIPMELVIKEVPAAVQVSEKLVGYFDNLLK
jgi:hypothetical protein